MNSYISYFKKVPAFWIAILIVLGIEITLYLIPDLHYIEGGGAFLTTYKKLVAEDSKQNYDILMYGDSRSLAIQGIFPKPSSPSMYNFSLPAAGARYFKYYLKKYLKNHKEKPKLIVWAADPEQFALARNKAFDTDPILWKEYKHRLLNLFSISESWEQYNGKERFFIIKESIPNLLLTVKYRQGIEVLFAGFKPSDLQSFTLPNKKRNLMIQNIVDKNLGQINLGDYFFGNEQIAQEELQKSLKKLDHSNYYLDPLVEFLDFCKENNLKVIVLNLPRSSGLNDTKYFQAVIPSVKQTVSKYPQVKYMEFPEMDYPNSLFAESIHYTTAGAKKLNTEFQELVYPKMIQFMEDSNDTK